MVTFSDRWSHCIKYAVQRHKMKPPNRVVFFLCCELCSRLRPTGSRSTTAKRSRWEIQRRMLWRSGQNLSAPQAVINFGHRKSASRDVASVRKNNFFCYCLTLRMFLFIEFGYDLWYYEFIKAFSQYHFEAKNV